MRNIGFVEKNFVQRLRQSRQMRGKGLFLLAVCAQLASGCGGSKTSGSKKETGTSFAKKTPEQTPQNPDTAKFEGLSQEEKNNLTSGPQEVLVIDNGGKVKVVLADSTSLEKIQSELAEEAAQSGVLRRTLVLNSSVRVERENEPGQANPGLLFSGKEEFGIAEWKKRFPLADGRGVIAGVVDDGVAPLRPGLITSSTDLPKVTLTLNSASKWRVPLENLSCTRKDVADLKTKVSSWTSAQGTTLLAPSGDRVPFVLSNCGVHPQMALGMSCTAWNNFLPKKILDAQTSAEGVTTIPAALAQVGSDKVEVLVDWNADGQVDAGEFVVVEKGQTSLLKMASGATAFEFSWVDVEKSTSVQDSLLAPSLCAGGLAQGAPELHVRPPESQDTSGSHGEGVASVLAGHKIPAAGAQSSFDGVAPGAQIVDVQLTLDQDAPYSIHSIGQALRLAGLNSDVVNLSYSLFFSTPAAQVSMKRYLDAVLNDTPALYFFSGGNNGPGRGSMNRKGLYPTQSVVSGAYLNAKMSQSVFGSALPWGGVVTYSSRGPSPDGSIPVDVISPLAATTTSTADGGFRDFSGTSSASPAMAGFASLLISAVKQESLPVDKMLVRKAIIDSGKMLTTEPAIDQGAGLPNLSKAFDLYKDMIQGNRLAIAPTLSAGNVYLRDIAGKRPVYTITIAPQFAASVTEAQKANYTEQLKLVPNAAWIQTPKDLVIGRVAETVQISIDEATAPKKGEALGEIKIVSVGTGEIRGVIPVTLLLPDSKAWSATKKINLEPAKVGRFFLAKPAGAKHLVVTAEEPNGNLCGYFQVHGPLGQRLSAPLDPTLATGFVKKEAAFLAPLDGLYELVVSGMGSHTICPKVQKVTLRAQWIGLSVNTEELSNNKGNLSLQISVQNAANTPVEGSFVLSKPSQIQEVILSPSQSIRGLYEGSALELTGNESWTLETGLLQSQFFGLPTFDLFLKSEASSQESLRRQDFQVSVSPGLWTPTPELTEAQLKSLYVPQLVTFEYGPTGTSQGSIRLQMSRALESEKDLSLISAHSALLSGFNRIQLTGRSETTPSSERSLSCSFSPAGFQSKLPCGQVSVTFP